MFKFILLVSLFRFALDWAYKDVVSTAYLYMGFGNYASFSMSILSWIFLITWSILFYFHFRNEKNCLLKEIPFFLFLISFVPFTSLMAFGMYDSTFIVWNLIYWVVLVLCTRDGKHHINRINFCVNRKSSPVLGDIQLKAIATLSILIVIYISGKYANFRLNFNLSKVYDLRADASAFSLPTVLDYAFAWTRMLNSILLAYFLKKRYYAWAIICFITQLFNFSIDGSKVTLFLLVFAVLINIIPKISMHQMNTLALVGLSGLILICMGLYKTQGDIMPISILVRRVFFIPARIQSHYFDFFTTHTPDYFRQSFLRYFGAKSPYPRIPLLIAEEYSKNQMNANNGLISDAVTNLGYIGIFVMPLLLSAVLRLLDAVSEGLDDRVYITVALYVAVTLTNSFLFTVLMTHGLLVTMVVLKLMRRDESSKKTIKYRLRHISVESD